MTEIPYTTELKKVFETYLPEVIGETDDASLAVLWALLSYKESFGTRMIAELTGREPGAILSDLQTFSKTFQQQAGDGDISNRALLYLQKSKREAELRGNGSIRTEHLLLALIKEPVTRSFQFLEQIGVHETEATVMLQALEELPWLIIKVFNRDPHTIRASLRLTPIGTAVGYFMEKNRRPGFALQTDLNLYRYILANESQFGKVTRGIHADAGIGYVFEFTYYAPARKYYYYSMPFDPESGEAKKLGDQIQQFLKQARTSAV